MHSKKLRVGIIFGGRSAEHEVSLQSASNVYEALDKTKYEPVLIGISKKGVWQFENTTKLFPEQNNSYLVTSLSKDAPGKSKLMLVPQPKDMNQLDVIFPVLHGPYGEDGTMQGLLKLAGIPFVGSDVLGSAVCMDKEVMKRLLKEASIPIAKYIVIKRKDEKTIRYAKVVRKLGPQMFVKPANLGSSVGVHKVTSNKEFISAITDAFQYDNKILIEQALQAREIECSVLGNDNPIASIPGEVITHHEFYSYEAKYLDSNGADLVIPAPLPDTVIADIKKLAVKTFQTLCCNGMARVDFFLTETNKIFVNEANTIPGFTNVSMYPKLWEASGISYTSLITRLIELALERHSMDMQLKTSK